MYTVYLPIECANARTPEAGSITSKLDCTNAEQTDDHLVITKLTLEVDARFGRYQLCNVCEDGQDPLGKLHLTDRSCKMKPYPEYVCDCMKGQTCDNRQVGMEYVEGVFSGRSSDDESLPAYPAAGLVTTSHAADLLQG